MNNWRVYFDTRLITILFLGFVSGLPLALTASTLSAWLAEAGVDKTAIGLFAAVAVPYSLKFLWSPLIDGMRIPLLCARFGRRRGWIIATQIALIASILALGMADPGISAFFTALAALGVATASATQDIVIDAYRVEILAEEEQGAGAAMSTLGYRIGMLVAGAGGLYLAATVGWQQTYVIMAALVGIGLAAALLAKEPTASQAALAPTRGLAAWFKDSVVAPFVDFTTHRGWIAVLLFIVLYKLGDAFLGVMTNPFLLEIGFSKQEIAKIVKLYGFFATIAGSFAGAWLVQKFGTFRPLILCGVFHALTNLMFLVQARVGADTGVLALGITLENFTGGMSAAVFVAYISVLCRVRYTATQYALLSSLAALGRTTLSTSAGWTAKVFGWEIFFVISVLLAFPSLFLLTWMQKRAEFETKNTA